MKQLLSLVPVFLFPGPTATAQVTSPSGYLSTEGEWSSAVLGSYPRGRFMLIDGDRRGPVTIVKEVAYRRDYQLNLGAGRAWSQVTIDYAPCDATVQTTTFSRVATTTPSRVFSGSVAWPAIIGPPPRSPGVWGGPSGRLKFPFAITVVSSGRTDLSFDYRFYGGTFGNSSPWTTSEPYYLDGFIVPRIHSAPFREHGNGATTAGCRDGATTVGGLLRVRSKTWNPPTSRVEVNIISSLTAPSAPVLHVVGVVGSAAGVRFPGLSCNKIHVDLGQSVLAIRQGTDNSGAAGTLLTAPYTPALAGLPLWAQAAWDDSVTRNMQLTNAIETSIVRQWKIILNRVLFAADPQATVATGTVTNFSPIVRYGR